MAVPDDRIELSTFCLQDRCSTDELNGLFLFFAFLRFAPLRLAPFGEKPFFPTKKRTSVHKDLVGDPILEAHPVRSHQEY